MENSAILLQRFHAYYFPSSSNVKFSGIPSPYKLTVCKIRLILLGAQKIEISQDEPLTHEYEIH